MGGIKGGICIPSVHAQVAPFLYYGDEIGMRYVENLHSVEGDYGRIRFPLAMQWDHTTNAGFSAAPKEKLYVKQDEATDRPTVEAQMADPDSLYHEIQKLINIRQAHSALQSRGEIEFVYAEADQYPLAYLRSDDQGEDSGHHQSRRTEEASFDRRLCGKGSIVYLRLGSCICRRKGYCARGQRRILSVVVGGMYFKRSG